MFTFICSLTSFAWIFCLGAFISFLMAIILIPYRHRSQSISWFQVFSILAGIIQLSQAWLGCTGDAKIYEFTVNTSQLLVLLPPVEIMFVIYFINQERWLRKFWLVSLLVVLPISMLMLVWGGDLIVYHNFATVVPGSWGFGVAKTGMLKNLHSAYLGIGFLLPIFLMIGYYRHLTHPQKKIEVRLILFGMLLPTVFGLLMEEAFPVFFHIPPIPASIPLVAVMNAIIVYAMIKYGLHIFNLNSATDNIIQIMPGGLVILDHIGTIQYVN